MLMLLLNHGTGPSSVSGEETWLQGRLLGSIVAVVVLHSFQKLQSLLVLQCVVGRPITGGALAYLAVSVLPTGPHALSYSGPAH